MKKQNYEALFAWFRARSAAKKTLWILGKAAVVAVYGAYLAALVQAALGVPAGAWQPALVLVAVPGAAFVLGTALRSGINRPRPYEAFGFTPLFPKNTRGQSMPSRHCFAAAAIAVTLAGRYPAAGAVLGVLAVMIAVCRVLAGHHYPSDVAAGLVFGTAAALAGLWLFASFGFTY